MYLQTMHIWSILYQKLSGISEPPEDIGNELIKFLQEKKKEVSDLTKICKANDIPHHFSNFMWERFYEQEIILHTF